MQYAADHARKMQETRVNAAIDAVAICVRPRKKKTPFNMSCVMNAGTGLRSHACLTDGLSFHLSLRRHSPRLDEVSAEQMLECPDMAPHSPVHIAEQKRR